MRACIVIIFLTIVSCEKTDFKTENSPLFNASIVYSKDRFIYKKHEIQILILNDAKKWHFKILSKDEIKYLFKEVYMLKENKNKLFLSFRNEIYSTYDLIDEDYFIVNNERVEFGIYSNVNKNPYSPTSIVYVYNLGPIIYGNKFNYSFSLVSLNNQGDLNIIINCASIASTKYNIVNY